MPQLCHMLVGPPASGKTTLAQQWLRQDPNFTWVSTDRIRETLYGNAAIQGAWPEIQQVVLQQIQQAISQGHSIVYDATNAQPQWRIDFLHQVAPFTTNQGIAWMAWLLLPPLETCLKRNQQRERQVPVPALERSYHHLVTHPPTTAEGFIAIQTLTE